MKKPNKLEEGQIWIYHCPINVGDTEKHIVTEDEAIGGCFVCEDDCSHDIESLLEEDSGWIFLEYVQFKEPLLIKKEGVESLPHKTIPLTRKDKVYLLNGHIAHFSLSKLVEMTDAEVDEEFNKLQTVTNSQFEGFKAVARVLVNNGYWNNGVDFNHIESKLNISD